MSAHTCVVAGTVQPHLAKSQRCSLYGSEACGRRAVEPDKHYVMRHCILVSGPQCLWQLWKNISSIAILLRLAVLSLHVRADAVTHEAATAVAADAAPAPAAEGIFLPPCSTTSPLPAAFCNIPHRFSKPISGDAHASVNETCSKFQHGIARFKSMKMRSADEGKTMFYECQASAFAVLRDRCACVMLTCDVGQV